MTALVRNSALSGFAELVRELGGVPEAMLAQCNLPRNIEMRQDAFLPYRALIELLEICAERLNCPDFGMRLARAQGIGILGPLAVVIEHSDTVRDAIEQGAKYLHVFNPGQRVTVFAQDKQLCLRFEIVLDNVARKRQAHERALVFIKRLTELGGNAPRPTQVLFADSPLSPCAVYRQVFGDTRLCFDQPLCGLDIDAAAMQVALGRSNRHIRSMAIAFLEQKTANRAQPVSARVREIVFRLLPMGALGIDRVAGYLNLNRRTLQRRLEEEGNHFAALVEQVRSERAESYLADGRLPLGQVAALLGYTEQSAFNRACRRWFATTPRRYRQRLQR